MAMRRVAYQTGIHDIAAGANVLSARPNLETSTMCIGVLNMDGLDGSGGDFELVVTIGGYTAQPSPQTLTFNTATSSSAWTVLCPVPAGAQVVLSITSPNGADTDVTVRASLFDASACSQDYAEGEEMWIPETCT